MPAMVRLSRTMRRFAHEQRAEGTSSGALRIAIWMVVALAVIGMVGKAIYDSASHTQNCLESAAGGGTSC